jgi:hypothetical protein
MIRNIHVLKSIAAGGDCGICQLQSRMPRVIKINVPATATGGSVADCNVA